MKSYCEKTEMHLDRVIKGESNMYHSYFKPTSYELL